MTGRGAWPVAGTGGTKKFKDASKPGPYYFEGSGEGIAANRDDNERAVHLAVKAYQRALRRRLGIDLNATGVYGPKTVEAVKAFQEQHDNLTVWGGIGPDTSKALLHPDIAGVVLGADNNQITVDIVSGTIQTESMWDAGAVGFQDSHDLGLAQINGPAHPNLSVPERFQPLVAYEFIVDYYENALDQLNNNIRDAIASYNLGIGGARRWISQGRPEWYTPAGASRPRNVAAYIDKILAG